MDKGGTAKSKLQANTRRLFLKKEVGAAAVEVS